jgi:tetratricopeptide (TPR) repeat protein
MLETIREFAASALDDSGEELDCRDRHLDWFADLAGEASGRFDWYHSSDWSYRLEPDRENLRAALTWALTRAAERGEDARGEFGGAAVALTSALAPLHQLYGRWSEAEEVLRTALALDPEPIDAARLQGRLGRILRLRESLAEGRAAHLEAVRLIESVEVRDERWWETWMEIKREQAQHYYFENDLGELGKVIAELRPVVEERGSPEQRLSLLHVLAGSAYRKERYALSEETEDLMREIHRLSQELDDSEGGFSLGFCLLWRGKLDEAAMHLQASLVDARRRGDVLIEVRSLVYGSLARRRLGDVETVRALLAELDALDDVLGYAGLVSANGTWLALRDGRLGRARELGGEALADWDPSGRSGSSVFQWTARFPLLEVALLEGDVAEALEHARAMLDPHQNPLPSELATPLAEAVEGDDALLLELVLDLARPGGYV